MSDEIEAMGNSIMDNRVPALWMAVAYPSMKPLGSWIIDFKMRLNMMQDWLERGPPATFWIAGFYFT
jgi:dynein heavy chain